MDTDTLVELQIDDGQQLIDALVKAGIDVAAAFWAKPTEERWSLFIVTKVVDEQGQDAAYREILRVLRELGTGWVTTSDVKAIGEKNPIAQDVIELAKRFPGRGPVRLLGRMLGGTSMDEVYLYSMSKVQIKLYGMTYGDQPGPLHLSLEPHDSNSSLLVWSGTNRLEYPAKVGMDWTIAAPVDAKIVRDHIGRAVLEWNFHVKRKLSDASEVLSLADLGMHGFRIIQEPKEFGKTG